MSSADPEWRCYKHTDREAGVRCRRCERFICPDCMVAAPVGFQCRACVKGAPAVRSLRTLQRDPHLTWALLAVNVLVFLPVLAGRDEARDLGLSGPAVAAGDWWRIVTSGFLHFDVLHLGFNMALLFWLGQTLEPALGRLRFGVLYAVSLLAGSLGALVLDPLALTGGASGAVFGLMGATVIVLHKRGIDPRQSGLVGLIAINLVLSFRPGISIGGHVGGLAGGLLAGAVFAALDDTPRDRHLGTAVVLVVAAVVVGLSLAVASNPL
jgi:membrane associated rhomboid family serine protease